MQIDSEVQPAPNYVAKYTNIPANLILAQWAYEQPEGITNPEKYNYNIAGLTKSGTPGVWREYDNMQDFAKDYVFSFLLKGYPEAVGAKDANTLAKGLKNGVYGSYYGTTSTSSYASGIKARYNQLFGDGDGDNEVVYAGPGSIVEYKPGGTITATNETAFTKMEGAITKLTNFVKYGPDAVESPAETEDREETREEIKDTATEVLDSLNPLTLLKNGGYILAGIAFILLGFWLMLKEQNPIPLEMTT